jgi:hypothetical protein
VLAGVHEDLVDAATQHRLERPDLDQLGTRADDRDDPHPARTHASLTQRERSS